jgi:hypothetical protein
MSFFVFHGGPSIFKKISLDRQVLAEFQAIGEDPEKFKAFVNQY